MRVTALPCLAAGIVGTQANQRAFRHLFDGTVEEYDSDWWHCDMIHRIAPVQDQRGWDNVMYIPAAPWCPRNEAYTPSVREAFLTGASPSDFPAGDYERSWPDPFTAAVLDAIGRRGLGLPA